MLRFGAVCAFAAGMAVSLACPAMAANSFALKKGLKWLIPAETRDIDEAIGVAQHFTDQHTMVVRNVSGTFDVIVGPFRASSVSQLLNTYQDMPALPESARMIDGQDLVDTVWTPKDDAENPAIVKMVELKRGKGKSRRVGELDVRAELHQLRGRNYSLTVAGKLAGKDAFKFDLASFGIDTLAAQAGGLAGFAIARLDASTELPQVIVTRYTGGAHCCTETWILTKPQGAARWQSVELGERDGNGFAFEDVDGDGTTEVIGIDNSFLYAFDAYADSYAPVQYFRLVGTRLADVSHEDKFVPELKRDLAYIEFDAKSDPQRWNSNGFLAAWVASKVRLGLGDDAWTTMLENYSKDNGFGPQKCLTSEEVENCPEANLLRISFPKALAEALQQWGYGPLPQTAFSAAE